MGIGGSIFLIAVGAIIAFGLHVQTGFLNLSIVGWVLMLAGVVGLFITLWVWNSRRRQVVTRRPVAPDPAHTRRPVVSETTYTDPGYVEERRTVDPGDPY